MLKKVKLFLHKNIIITSMIFAGLYSFCVCAEELNDVDINSNTENENQIDSEEQEDTDYTVDSNQQHKEIGRIEVKLAIYANYVGYSNYFNRGQYYLLKAEVYATDGSIITGEDAEVKWELGPISNNSYTTANVTTYKDQFGKDQEGFSMKIDPEEETPEITVYATSVKNPSISGSLTMYVKDTDDTDELNAKLGDMTWQYGKDSIKIGIAYEANHPGVKFRCLSYDLDKQEWNVVSDWSRSNRANWKAEKGNYWIHWEAMSADGKCFDSNTMCFAYNAGNTNISGTYAGNEGDHILLGATSDNPDAYIAFKIYDIENNEWIYLTDELNRANWVTWMPKRGHYWVHFEARTADGRLSDTKTYGFTVE